MRIEKDYKCDMGKNELTITCFPDKMLPGYYEKMLVNDCLPMLIRFKKDQSDGMLRLVYDTDNLCRLDIAYENKKPGFEQINRLFLGIIEAVEKSEEYLMDEQDFLISPDGIFIDKEGNTHICCIPGYERPLKEQFTELFEYLMDKLDYRDRHAVVAVYELYRKSKETVCGFNDIRQVLEQKFEPAIPGDNYEEPTAGKYESATECKENPRHLQEMHQPKITELRTPEGNETPSRSRWSLFGSRKNTRPMPENRTETATTLLYRPPECSEFIMKAEDGRENINLNKFPFYIGKAGANLNVELSYPQISRVHAKLTLSAEKEIMVEDLGSLNGTFVNQNRLQKGQRIALKAGDRVALANRVYVFTKSA